MAAAQVAALDDSELLGVLAAGDRHGPRHSLVARSTKHEAGIPCGARNMRARLTRLIRWLTPAWVAFAGVALVVTLLVWPIATLGPGDHERSRCGNALSLDLGRWRDVPDGEYLERAFRHCSDQRLDRIARAAMVGSSTFLLVTIMLAHRPRSPAPREEA